MSAGRVQLAAKGVQDQYLTGSPQISFFNTMYTKHTPFLVRILDIPANNPLGGYGTLQVCDLSRAGDVIRSITLKITLPSMFQSGYGLAYPSQIIRPTFYYLDQYFNVTATYFARNIRHFFSTNDSNWLPPVATAGPNGFLFTGTATYIAFADLNSASFWGFKNYTQIVNGLYIWPFTGSSEISFFSGGWVNANSNYFRYYAPNGPINLVQSVSLYLGGQLIENVPGQYITIYNDLNYETQQTSLSNISGTTLTLAASDIDFYVKVPFSFVNIPAAAIQSVEVKVQLGKLASALDSNAFNITQFSNLATVTTSSATTDGTRDFLLSNGNLLTFIGSNLVANCSMGTALGIATDLSNVYGVGGPNVYKYVPSSNTMSSFYIPAAAGYGSSQAICMGQAGLFCYGSGLQIFKSQFTSYEFPYSAYLATSFNGLTFAATANSIVIQNAVTPYIFNSYLYQFGQPIQMAANNTVYYTTSNSLVKWTGTGFSQVAQLTGAPNCIVPLSDRVIMFYPGQVQIVTGLVQSFPVNFTVVAAQYVKQTTLVVSLASGTVSIWDYTNPTVLGVQTLAFSYITTLAVGTNNVYAMSAGSNLYQFPVTGSIVTNTSSPLQLGAYFPSYSNYLFAFDSTTSRMYLTANGSSNIMYTIDGGPLSPTLINPNFPTVTGLSNVYFDGQYMYSYPLNGTVAYKLNTFTNFTANSSHFLSTLLDNFGNPRTGYTSGVAFDGQNLIVAPNSSFPDQNVIVYNTTIPFSEPTASYLYSGYLLGGRDYSSIATFGRNMFIGSNSIVYRYQYSPGYVVTNFQNYSYNFGAATDGRKNLLIFNSNLSSNGVSVYSFGSGATTTQIQLTNYPGNYNVTVQQNSDTVLLIPRDNANVLSFSVTQQTASLLATLNQFPNSSNAACIAGNNLYIFPSPQYNNLFVINLTTRAVSNIWVPRYNYQGASYDGNQYIYTTDPYGNVYRFNTSTDIFTDLPGWTVGSPTLVQNAVSQSVTYQGNVYFTSSQNIFVTNVLTKTTSNLLAGFNSAPIVARQPISNVLFFATTSNLWRYSTNTLVSNLTTAYLVDRTTTTKTLVDLTASGSNVYISWSDSTLGTLDLTSNDLNGMYYTVPVSTFPGPPTATIIVNSNVYVATTDNIARIGTTQSVRLADSNPAAPSNVYSVLLSQSGNIYALPSNGNVFTRVTEATLSVDRYTSNVSNIGAALIKGSTMYAFSKTSNTTIAMQTGYSLASAVGAQWSVFGANGASCCFVSTDSNLYVLPYSSNVVSAFSLPTFNFSNSAVSQSATLVGPISNVITGTNTWVLSQTGVLANVLSGTIGTPVPMSDYLRGRLAYQATPSSNLYGVYTGNASLGTPTQAYGPIQVSSSSRIDFYLPPGTFTWTPSPFTLGYFAMWTGVTTPSNLTFASANVTNHSWFSVVYTFGTYTFTTSGFCQTLTDLAASLNSTASAYSSLPTWAVSGSGLYLSIRASTVAYTVSGTLGGYSLQQSAPAGQALAFTTPAISLSYNTSYTGSYSGLVRVVIVTDPAVLSPSGDYYWSPSTLNFSNLIPSFANQWLATQDGSSFVNTTNGSLSVLSLPSSGYYDSAYAAGSNVVLANSTTGTTLLQFNPVNNSTLSLPIGPVVNIGYNQGYMYTLSETPSVAINMYDLNNALIGTPSVPSANVIGSRISVPISDGSLIYVQSTFANLTAVSLGYTQSFDYRAAWGVTNQQYSCVLSVNNVYYLLPGNGNVIAQVTSTTGQQVNSSYIIGFDVNNAFSTSSSYRIMANPDQYSNIIFTCVNTSTRVANIIKYNTLTQFNNPSSWSGKIQASNIISNVAVFSAGYQLAFSNVDSNVAQYSLVGAPTPWYSYSYPWPASAASNISFVTGGNAYMFPSTASNIVTFNVASKSFSYISHDQPVLAVANVGSYTVVVNPTKINVFQTATMTSVAYQSFANPAGNVYSTAYDGRYLHVLAGSGEVAFDFSSLAKIARPVYSNVYYTMINTGSNLIASNLVTYASLGYSPRPYQERILGGIASGLLFTQSNLYAKVGTTIQNLTQGSSLVSASGGIAIDSRFVNNLLYVLSPGSLTSVNVFTLGTLTANLSTEYSSELLTDGSNIFVPSTQTLNVWRISNNFTITVAQSTYSSKSKYYVNQYLETSNLVLITDQNQQVVFNPNPQSSSPLSNAFLPNQLQNNYASIFVSPYIYFFPGNAYSNQLQIYNTTQPFLLSSSYNQVYIGNNDIRSLSLVGSSIIGTPYTTSNFITYNTQTGATNTYYLDTSTLITSNGYIQSVFAGQSYFLIPKADTYVRRIFPSQTITPSSFNFPVPLITLTPEQRLAALVTYGKTLAIITGTRMYLTDMTQNAGIISPLTAIYNSTIINTAYFDGRFVKLFTGNTTLYDTLPISFSTTVRISCIVNAAYLNSKEVNWMRTSQLDYVIQQIQTSNVSANGYYRMYLTGPVSEIMFTGPLTKAELILNGYSKGVLDSTYMSVLAPYWGYNRTPSSNVLVMPLQPYVNMSRIKEQVLYLNAPVSMYAKNYNVVRVKDGLAGLIFT